MRKIYSLLVLSLLISLNALAQHGWRNNEKEVHVALTNSDEFQRLQQLHLTGDIGLNGATLYVTPNELNRLKASSLNYEVTIPDMNTWAAQYGQNKVPSGYYTWSEIKDIADSLANKFPSIVQKIVYGTSVDGKELAALKISDNVTTDEAEAEILFDAGIHGDEVGGPENAIRFARQIVLAYGNNPEITSLINNREIFIYYAVNPYGRNNMTRYNANGVDLNRDWGYMWNGEGNSPAPHSQPETKALRNCLLENNFVVHTTYHSGIEYISCPWSYRSDTPADAEHILQLAGVYSSTSGYGSNGLATLEYGQGSTGMYFINGASKDYNYGIQSSVTWSMEISQQKQPPASQIGLYYNANKPAMINMIQYAGYGIEGIVKDYLTNEPIAAQIWINDFVPCYSDKTVGDFHKYVTGGTYTVKVTANGYESETIQNVIVPNLDKVHLNVFLSSTISNDYGYRVVNVKIPDNNSADEGNVPAAIGAPDQINYSLGINGSLDIELLNAILDGPGNDITIHEGDSSPEGYKVFAGETIDGPWHELGNGNGTSSFDLAMAGISECSYIRITDDGDGTNGADAGFDLDAIEVLEHIPGVYIAMTNYTFDDSQGNNNGRIDPGESVDVTITLRNNGDITANAVNGVLNSTSSFITITEGNATFGTMEQGATAEATFTIEADENTPAGSAAAMALNITANEGTYSNNFSLQTTIGQIPVAVIDLDGNHNSGPVIKTTLEDAGVTCEYLSSIPEHPELYTSLFVCLGSYSVNHALSATEGQELADFLNNGGNLYMEGGDTWKYDTPTAVHAMFGITPEADGSGDLSTLTGQSGSLADGLSFSYNGDNNYIDHITASGNGILIFKNQSPEYGTAVSLEGDNYSTIGASFEFGGLTDNGTNTKAAYMERITSFFGINTALSAAFTTNQTEVCTETAVEYENLSTGAITSYQWTFEGGIPATSTDKNPSITYNTPGTYDVSLTVSDGTDEETITLNEFISVYTTPETPNKPDGPFMLLSKDPVEVTYTTDAVANATDYVWKFSPAESGTVVANGTEALFTPTQGWIGHVEITVQGINGSCHGSWSDIFNIEINYDWGIQHHKNSDQLKIRPNPSHDIVTIQTNNIDGQATLTLTTLTGKQVYQKPVSLKDETSIEINIQDLSPGLYILSLQQRQHILKKKLCIQ